MFSSTVFNHPNYLFCGISSFFSLNNWQIMLMMAQLVPSKVYLFYLHHDEYRLVFIPIHDKNWPAIKLKGLCVSPYVLLNAMADFYALVNG